MVRGAVLDRYFGWKIRRVELVASTVIGGLIFASAILLGGGPLALGFALLTGAATGLLLKGDIDAVRGHEPADWLKFVGFGYVLLGLFAVLNVTSIAALSLSGVSAGLVVALAVAVALGVYFLGRGFWFVTVSL